MCLRSGTVSKSTYGVAIVMMRLMAVGLGRYSGTFEIDVNVHAVLDVHGCVRRHHEQLRVHVEAHLAVLIGDTLPPEVPSNTCTIDKAVYTHSRASSDERGLGADAHLCKCPHTIGERQTVHARDRRARLGAARAVTFATTEPLRRTVRVAQA